MPPTERNGRVHTSTVTVVVTEAAAEKEWKLNEKDLVTFVTKDSGPGGQHRNKTESCIVMRHVPTGIEAKAASKSQHANRKMARLVLESRVRALLEGRRMDKQAGERNAKRGSGMRGDKIRTYRVRDNIATDDRTRAKQRLSDVLAGKFQS